MTNDLKNIDNKQFLDPKFQDLIQNSNIKSKKNTNLNEASHLHKSEIVYGTVINKFKNNLVQLRLPTGTFKAKINSNLNIGDSLFFKVLEITPNLELQVRAINSIISNKIVKNEEVLRLLAININDNYINHILDVTKENQTLIVKDDVLLIHSIILKLQYENKVQINHKIINRVYDFIEEGFQYEPQLFNLLFPSQNIEEILEKFCKEFIYDSPNKDLPLFFNNLKIIKDVIENSVILQSTDINIILDSALNILLKFENDLNNSQKILINNLIESITSFSLWNYISKKNHISHLKILTFKNLNNDRKYKLVKANKEDSTGNYHISFKLNTKNFGELNILASVNNDLFSCNIFTNENQYTQILEDGFEELKNDLNNFPFKNVKINISKKNQKQKILSPEHHPNPNHHFSIVI